MKQPVQIESRVKEAVSALMSNKDNAYVIGFVEAQLKQAIAMLPKSKQEQVLEDFESAVGAVVKVKVTNLMTDKEVEIPFHWQGNRALDPSMEGYWSM